MANVLDEVDEILNEMDAENLEGDSSDTVENNFNDSELQDIMAEIESLEEDFEVEAAEEVEAKPIALTKSIAEVKSVNEQTDLQTRIDLELEMSLKVLRDEAEAEAENTAKIKMKDEPKKKIVESKPTVLTFDKSAEKSIQKSTGVESLKSIAKNAPTSEVSFEGHGQMNLNLGFKIGEENAKLTIDPVKGLILVMSGVELCINQEDGCKVTMDSGVKFIIPLTSPQSILKKKSA